MCRAHFRNLIQRCKDGTLSEEESGELRDILRERARCHFDICPACGGAFSAELRLEELIRCPNCDTFLSCWSSDLSANHPDEVDPSLSKSQVVGEFVTGYSIPGVQLWGDCGTLYPLADTRCPRALLYNCGVYGKRCCRTRRCRFQPPRLPSCMQPTQRRNLKTSNSLTLRFRHPRRS